MAKRGDRSFCDGRPLRARSFCHARRAARVENACRAHAWNAGQQVRYWREEPLELDAIVDESWDAWAIEVKTGDVDPVRLRGLAESVRRHPRHRPLVLCGPAGVVAGTSGQL